MKRIITILLLIASSTYSYTQCDSVYVTGFNPDKGSVGVCPCDTCHTNIEAKVFENYSNNSTKSIKTKKLLESKVCLDETTTKEIKEDYLFFLEKDKLIITKPNGNIESINFTDYSFSKNDSVYVYHKEGALGIHISYLLDFDRKKVVTSEHWSSCVRVTILD